MTGAAATAGVKVSLGTTSTQSTGGAGSDKLSRFENLTGSAHGHEPGEPGEAGGGNATAANRIVNAIPAVCAAAPGILSPLDIPPITGAAQMRA